MIYLEQHPPARSQYRPVRRGWGDNGRRLGPSGAIVMHTPENMPDLVPPDHGAENVAQFIATRTDAAGSYHSVSDSDSTVQVGHYHWEMFGEGTGGNRWALHLACACKAAQWPVLPAEWVAATLRNAATEARRMADWVIAETGIAIPAKRISAEAYRRGEPGFVAHGDLDPDRRSDPGVGFPWDPFLSFYAGEPTQLMPLLLTVGQVENLRAIQKALGPVTGRQGAPFLESASVAAIETLVEHHIGRSAEIARLETRIDELLADDAGDASDAQAYRAIEGTLIDIVNAGDTLHDAMQALRAVLERGG